MRTLLAILLLLPLAAFADDMRAASHYLNDPDKYLGQKITLNCCRVERLDQSITGSDDICFRATTASRGQWETSYITVRVPKDAAEQFARKYGSSNNYDTSQTRPLSGTFSKDEKSPGSSNSSNYSHHYNSDPYFLAYTPSS